MQLPRVIRVFLTLGRVGLVGLDEVPDGVFPDELGGIPQPRMFRDECAHLKIALLGVLVRRQLSTPLTEGLADEPLPQQGKVHLEPLVLDRREAPVVGEPRAAHPLREKLLLVLGQPHAQLAHFDGGGVRGCFPCSVLLEQPPTRAFLTWLHGVGAYR